MMTFVMFLSSLVKYWAAPDVSPEKPCFLYKRPLSSLQSCSTFPEGHNDGSQTFIGFSGILASGLEDNSQGFQLDLVIYREAAQICSLWATSSTS